MNKRKSIVTGSIKYSKSQLVYPKLDVGAIKQILSKRCKFKEEDVATIIHDEELNDEDYLKKIQNICYKLDYNKTDSYDLILFYYSGHGVYDTAKEKSFLQISDKTYVEIDRIIEMISNLKAKHKYFIIDACESGGYTLMRRKGMYKEQRKYIYNSSGVYCMFGTTKDKEAYEPASQKMINKGIQNIFYTHFILEALNTKRLYHEDGTISIKIIDDYASKHTLKNTNFDQIPFSSTESAGYFPLGFWGETIEREDISVWKNERIFANNNTNNDIADLIFSIKKLFIESDGYLGFTERKALSKLSQSSKELLNREINLPNKKYKNKPLINGLIGDSQKRPLLTFLLEEDNIYIDLSLEDNDGNTVLIEAINNSNHIYSYIIWQLFIRGYQENKNDINFLNTSFKKRTTYETLMNVTVAIICIKLRNKKLISKAKDIESLLLKILSFKKGKVIGSNINHNALATTFFDRNKQYAFVFIKALKKYGYYDNLIKRPKFKNKIINIQQELPYQNSEYDDVLKKIFPELF